VVNGSAGDFFFADPKMAPGRHVFHDMVVKEREYQ
jgi:hypothetical protein